MGERVIGADVVASVERSLIATVEQFTARDRLRWGIDREELRERLGLGGVPLFDFMLERGNREGRLFFKGGQVRTGSGERELSGADRTLLSRLESRIAEAGFTFLNVSQLRDLVSDGKRLIMYLRILEEDGTIVKVAPDSYLHGDVHRELLRLIGDRLAGGGTISVGEFKDLFNFSRKYAVPLLEYLDNEAFEAGRRPDGGAPVQGGGQ